MREKQIEQRLVKAVKARGGLCPKLVSPGTDGMPDRMVLLPDSHMGFVEVKAPGEKPRPLQHRCNNGGMSNYGNWDIRFQFSTILNKSPQSWTRYGGDRSAQRDSTEVRQDRNGL